jgi:hypothetical protein
VDVGAAQLIDAVRVDPEAYRPSAVQDRFGATRAFVAPVPLTSLFLDLPLLTGDEVEHAPFVAATAAAWPGSAAVYQSGGDENFELNTLLNTRATIGQTRSILSSARPGRFDAGGPLEVELFSGALSSAPITSLLNGANVAAIGDGSTGSWEIIQFGEAEMIAPNRYLLTRRLRGQLGSEIFGHTAWPEGSWFVLLDGAPQQIALPRSLQRVAQTYRVGPAQRAFDDPSYSEVSHAFDGNGLRPYAPVHLRATAGSGGLDVSWIRRTRIDGDAWDLVEVPLGEESELYRVRVIKDGGLVREEAVTAPDWTYTAAAQTADAIAAPFDIRIAQMSARFGAGGEAVLTL